MWKSVQNLNNFLLLLAMHARPTDYLSLDTCSQKVFGGLHNFNWKAHLANPLGDGSFSLKFTHRNIVEETRPIPYNASATLMQTTLQELQELQREPQEQRRLLVLQEPQGPSLAQGKSHRGEYGL